MYDEEEKVEQEQPGVVERTVKKGVNYGKNKAINAFWEWIKPHLMIALPILGKAFLILCTIGLTFGIIQTILIPASATENPDSVASVEEADIVYLGDNGEYKISVENLADQILENLETQKINNEAVGFSSDDLDNMIDKYIKAEIQTTYPETGASGNEFDGIIKIYRASAETGSTALPLRYMKYDDFKDYSGGDVLEYFSLEPETFKLCIAREGDSITYKDRNGNPISGIDGASNEGIVKELIEYKTALQNYSVPLNFFTTLHMMSQDVNFMNDFVDKVLGKDKTEPIVLTYVESKSTTTTKKEYTGTKTINKISTTINNETNMPTTNPVRTKEGPVNIDEDEVLNYYSPDYFQEVRVETSGWLEVTKADTWLKTVEKTITENNSLDDENWDIVSEKNLETITRNLGEENNVNEEDNTTTHITKIATINATETTKVNPVYKGYTIVESQNKMNVDEFAEWLLNDYPRVANNLSTAPSMLFYLLEQNENTQQLGKIMRYVIYKLTGTNYGYTNVSMLDLYSFNTITGMYGSTVKEKVWWALIDAGYEKHVVAGAMGNINEESGFLTNNVQNTCESRVGTDQEYTEKVNNGTYTEDDFAKDSVGYGLCQWTTEDRKRNLYKYTRDKGVGIDDVDAQINFFLGELTGKGDAAAYTNRRYKGSIKEEGITATHDDWKNAKTVEEATLQFMRFFESPLETDSLSDREKTSKAYFEEFKDAEKPKFDGQYSYVGVSCPRYCQRDKQWDDYPYNYKSEGTIGSGGCGASALAMAVSGLTGQIVTPKDIVEYLNSLGINTVYNGTKCAQVIAKKYGLTYEYIDRSKQDKVNEALDSGKCLIFSIRANGIYTGEGHFIMCHGRSGDNYYVLDSASREYYKTNQPYKYNQVFTIGSQGIFALGK